MRSLNSDQSTDSDALRRVRPELERIMIELDKSHSSREFLIKNMRDVLVLCSRSIVSVHNGNIDRATRQFEDALAMFKKHKQQSARDMHSYLGVAEQELVESACLLSIVKKKSMPTPRSLGVSGASYALGLLDLIGELKRLTLDMVRLKRYGEACEIFDITVGLYDELSAFAIFGNSVKDIRKKIDMARIMIDGMRGTITGVVGL